MVAGIIVVTTVAIITAAIAFSLIVPSVLNAIPCPEGDTNCQTMRTLFGVTGIIVVAAIILFVLQGSFGFGRK